MRRALSLTQRLNLLVLAALAPALLLLVYTQVTQRSSRMEEARQSAFRAGEQASLEMQRIISGAQLLLEAIGNAPAVKTFDQALCAPFLAGVVARAPQFSAMGVYDPSGRLRCRNLMPSSASSASTLPSFKEAMDTGRFTVGRYQKGEMEKDAFLPLAAPILDGEGKPAGVVIASLDLGWLKHIVEDRRFDDSSALTVADRDGTIVARHPFSERFVGTRIPDQFLPLERLSVPERWKSSVRTARGASSAISRLRPRRRGSMSAPASATTRPWSRCARRPIAAASSSSSAPSAR